MLPKVGKDVGKSTKWILLGNISSYGVETITDAKVISVKDGKVVYEKDDNKITKEFDNIINAVGSKSTRKIADLIEQTDIPYSIVGDCVRPAQINNAIHEAFLAVMAIE